MVQDCAIEYRKSTTAVPTRPTGVVRHASKKATIINNFCRAIYLKQVINKTHYLFLSAVLFEYASTFERYDFMIVIHYKTTQCIIPTYGDHSFPHPVCDAVPRGTIHDCVVPTKR